MTGEGIAAIILAGGTVAGQLATIIMQFRTGKIAQSNADKLDVQGGKIDDIHSSTAAIAESTGTHKVLPPS